MTIGLLDIGPIELLILTAAAVMLFGGDLPDMARRAGHVIGRLRASARELTRELDPPPDLGRLPEPGSGGRPDERTPEVEPGDPPAPPAGRPGPTEPPADPPPG